MTRSVGDNGYASRVADAGRDHDHDRIGLMAKLPRPRRLVTEMIVDGKRLTIDDLVLSVRAENVIAGRNSGEDRPINSIDDLVGCTRKQFARRAGCGPMVLKEIEEQLATFGLAFRTFQFEYPWYEFCL